MILDEDRGLRDRLCHLKQEHRDLDMAISSLTGNIGGSDQLKMQRMKKMKLQLRDQISRIEDELYPDIIA